MQAPSSEKKKYSSVQALALNFRLKTEQTAVYFLVFKAFETKMSPVLISPTTTNQDQASNEVLRHAKSITFTTLCRGTPALLDSLSTSLCCLHPCRGRELWKVFQSCSNSIYFPNSSGPTGLLLWIKGAGGCFFLPVPEQNRRQLLFLTNPEEQVNFFASFGWLGMLQTPIPSSQPFLTIPSISQSTILPVFVAL